MTEQEAIELLGKLEKFMKDTNRNCNDMIVRIHNLEVDMANVKKQQEKAKLIITR
jgi:hypothetical protein